MYTRTFALLFWAFRVISGPCSIQLVYLARIYRHCNSCILLHGKLKVNHGMENNLLNLQYYFMTEIQIQNEVLNKRRLDAHDIYRTALRYPHFAVNTIDCVLRPLSLRAKSRRRRAQTRWCWWTARRRTSPRQPAANEYRKWDWIAWFHRVHAGAKEKSVLKRLGGSLHQTKYRLRKSLKLAGF